MIFQDYMFFDPFVYHGMAEMHDRHRDMRLDVDNMSYEVKGGYMVFLSTNSVAICYYLIINWDFRNCWRWRSA